MSLLQFLRRFKDAEDGGITAFSILLIIGMAMVGGFAIDFAHLFALKTQMQVAADSASHGALYKRHWLNPSDARGEAMKMLDAVMPESQYGDYIRATDIRFGRYDVASDTFNVDEMSKTHAMVTVNMEESHGNPISSYLMQFVGVTQWDLQTTAVTETWQPSCLQSGIAARGTVSMTSNNSYQYPYCIYSETQVTFQNNNTFEAGVRVSAPDTGMISAGGGTFGLEDALVEDVIELRILDKLPEIIADLDKPDSPYRPAYLVPAALSKTVSPGKLSMTDFAQGFAHRITCSDKQSLEFQADTYSKIVVVTNCNIKFAQGADFQDAIIATTSASVTSMSSTAKFQVGRPDNCVPGGEAQLLTLGGFKAAATLGLHSGQIIALGDVNFTANADGLRGSSIVAGGKIDGTANMTGSFCEADPIVVPYYRLVR